MQDPPPLILTLDFDEATFARFDGERRRFFPEALSIHATAGVVLAVALPADFDRGALPALAALDPGGQVVYMNTFSRTLAPC